MELRTVKKGNAYKVKTSHEWASRLRDAGEKSDTCPFVISLIGDTNAGKSTLREIFTWDTPTYKDLCQKKQGSDPHRVGYCGNSANVSLYQKSVEALVRDPLNENDDTEENLTSNNIYVLDMEGTDATGIPTMLSTMLKSLDSISPAVRKAIEWMLKNPEDRRNAVDFLFPLIGALLSDVVVYISRDTFATNEFYSRMAKLAGMVSRVDNLTPDLILISNFCSLADVKDSQVLTDGFFGQEGRTVQAMGFRSVRCFSVPDMFARGDSVWDENREDFIAPCTGAREFVAVSQKIQEYVTELISQRVLLKKALKLNLSEKMWLSLARMAIEDLPPSNNLKLTGKVFSLWSKYYALATEIPVNQQLFQLFFHELFDKLHDPEISYSDMKQRWKQWQKLGTYYFAGHQILGARRVLQDATPTLDASLPTHVLEAYLQSYDSACEFFSGHEVCASTITTASGKIVRCMNTKNHHMDHKNPIKLFEATTDENIVVRLGRRFLAFLGFGYPSVWPGYFATEETGDVLYDINGDKQLLTNVLEVYWKKTEDEILKGICSELCQLETQFSITLSPLIIQSDEVVTADMVQTVKIHYCVLCFQNISSKTILCTNCLDIYQEVCGPKA
eukprot:TRINITY_DN2588_c0_g1_i2.p1 TRINITY_DN2588_c0_g1~~TRINITY_DN2588_c0_g1_i2.p1  ORF type:complete len:617 (-),score=71.86 TRINITY_DN2588_c0_g1_i2:43-1893(-)